MLKTYSKINEFYSIYRDEKTSHTYDLKPLEDNTFRFAGGAYFSDQPNQDLGKSTPTNSEDYDLAFIEKVEELKQPYLVNALLNYHFNYYVGERYGRSSKFVKHIKFVVLPKLKEGWTNLDNKVRVEIMQEWIEQMGISLQNEIEEKNNYFIKAAEYAKRSLTIFTNFHTVKVMTWEVIPGKDSLEVLPILDDLVEEQYIRFGNEKYLWFNITPGGKKYLETFERKKVKKNSKIEITAGDNANIQVQQDVVQSQQIQKISELNTLQLQKVLSELQNGIPKLHRFLNTQQLEDIEHDINYLERTIKKAAPDKNIIGILLNNIITLLKPIPSHILSSTFSDTVLRLLMSLIP